MYASYFAYVLHILILTQCVGGYFPVFYERVVEIIKMFCDVLVFTVPPVTIGRDESRSRLSLSKAQEMSRMLVQPRDSSPINPTV